MKPVRPCGVSDCGSSPTVALAFGVRMSSTIASISPRQTPTAPHTFCAHSPAGTGSPLSSSFPISAVTPSTSTTPTAMPRIQVSGPRPTSYFFPGADSSSTTATSNCQNRSTVGMLTRSSGECGNSI